MYLYNANTDKLEREKDMAYEAKIDPKVVIAGYIGKSTSPAAKVAGYTLAGKKAR